MSASYSIGIVIPAGGRGRRFGGDRPKQFVELDGVAVIVRTLQTALCVACVKTVVVAAHPDEHAELASLLQQNGCADVRLFIVDGSTERHLSVGKGLSHPSLDDVDVILIHDAVRPLASVSLFERVADSAMKFDAVIPGIPVTDTLKRIDGQGIISETVDRSTIRRAQTPQGFRAALIRDVYAAAIEQQVGGTDCSTLCERVGIRVHVIEGEEQNIKVTTPPDLALASALLRSAASSDT